MATPVYNTPSQGYNRGHYGGRGGYNDRGGYHHPGGYGGSGRTWGIVAGNGSVLGGNTPPYVGGGQPPEDSGSWFGHGTPVYRVIPAPITNSTAMTTPSTTANAPTEPPPAPQPGQMAIIVPRS